MSEDDHEDARENRERAVASLLDGGERVAKGRQRDGDESAWTDLLNTRSPKVIDLI